MRKKDVEIVQKENKAKQVIPLKEQRRDISITHHV